MCPSCLLHYRERGETCEQNMPFQAKSWESCVFIEGYVLPETATMIREIAALFRQEVGEVFDRLVPVLPSGFKHWPLDEEFEIELAAVPDIHDFEDRREAEKAPFFPERTGRTVLLPHRSSSNVRNL